MNRIIECVPNISEGREEGKIKEIAGVVESVEGVQLLNVDPGKATNRTVITFAGEPEQVSEAAFRLIKKASELIDMSAHHGEHPRMGATDVCPLVPISGISMEEAAAIARQLGQRVGTELGIPVYLYEYAATAPYRKSLSDIRTGEYERLAEKLKDNRWKPDFGPDELNELIRKTGATVIGARDFLIAYNVNLNTTSVRKANSVAFDIREKGRVLRQGNPVTGEPVKDEKGNEVWVPGSLKAVKAIGWFIDEYGIAQVSINLTNLNITPLHTAFDEARKKAAERGIIATGSEIVGLVPLNSMLEAGRYFLRKQKSSAGISETELLNMAIKSLGLNDLYPFKPEEKIIEYMLMKNRQNNLIQKTVAGFADEVSSESPAPGGGSVAALSGALGAALAAMVANLSANKRGWEERTEEFSAWAEEAQHIKEKLLKNVDEDTLAFKKLMEAFALPKNSNSEKSLREKAVDAAVRYAADVPLSTLKLAVKSFESIRAMAEKGNPNSISDAGVAAACARAAAVGAWLNVKRNAVNLKDKNLAGKLALEAEELKNKALAEETEIIDFIDRKLKK